MALQLSGSVGRAPADNRSADVILVQAFMTAWLNKINSPQIGIAAVWKPGVYDNTLGDVIQFFQKKRTLPWADGRVDRDGRTWKEMVSLVKGGLNVPEWIDPPSPNAAFTDLKVLRFRQTLPGNPAGFKIPAIAPASVTPFLFRPVPKNAILIEGSAEATIRELLIKIEKNGVIFWVGAVVPAGTSDFSRAYLFFHPDTIGPTDDAGYADFTGRWPTVQRYVVPLGLQMAAVKQMVLIVPFMTCASRSNAASTNLFADRGLDTLNDIMTAIQISVGQTGIRQSLARLGVSSYSSGVNHLARFASKLGGTGVIGEQIDFDSPFMRVSHSWMPVLPGTANWTVTQSPPPAANKLGWLHLPQPAFRQIKAYGPDVHTQIGFMMFQSMMTISSVE
jgi:hypothetical protein